MDACARARLRREAGRAGTFAGIDLRAWAGPDVDSRLVVVRVLRVLAVPTEVLGVVEAEGGPIAGRTAFCARRVLAVGEVVARAGMAL